MQKKEKNPISLSIDFDLSVMGHSATNLNRNSSNIQVPSTPETQRRQLSIYLKRCE